MMNQSKRIEQKQETSAYRLSVPFRLSQVDRYGAEPFIRTLQQIGADTVVLALGCYTLDAARREVVRSSLARAVPLFREAGFTVGVWVWTFMFNEDVPYVHMESPNGRVSRTQVCPSDRDFCAFSYAYLQMIAACRPDLILFDDDFRYGFQDHGLGCTCRNHRAYMESLLGETLPAEGLGKRIFGGGPGRYRSAFLQANGHFLREFARQSRAAVDSIDPEIRLGLCSCMTTWDFDGVSSDELARILAGKTRPLCRLIGAPYWSNKRSWGNRLQDVIELERMESAWCGEGIELLAEGDSYRRPRFTCPASVLEGFDMALRASGAVNGIHKYVLDYYADPAYETGYVAQHRQHLPLYRQIDTCFGGKTPVGVRVYEHMTKFEDMEVPAAFDGSDEVQNTFFSPAARLLAAQSIPSIYRGQGTVGIAFGENVKYLGEDALSGGLILDATAAQYLSRAGVDVGLVSVGDTVRIDEECFPDRGRYVGLFDCPIRRLTLREGAQVQSVAEADGVRCAVSYSYRNAAGQSFLVFAFEGYTMTEHAFKQYARGEQIEAWIASLGKRLPASLHGNPDCYLLCREDGEGRAVWIGNFFADACTNTTVLLDRAYGEIEWINCRGRLLGDRVEIEEIAPYASVGFCVRCPLDGQ